MRKPGPTGQIKGLWPLGSGLGVSGLEHLFILILISNRYTVYSQDVCPVRQTLCVTGSGGSGRASGVRASGRAALDPQRRGRGGCYTTP